MSRRQKETNGSGWREKLKWGVYDVQCALHKKFSRPAGSKKTATLRKSRVNEILFIIAVLIFPLTIFGVFYVGVNINSILLAFQEYDIRTGEYIWSGFGNFAEFFEMLKTESFMGHAWVNTVILFVINLAINLPFHILNAYYVYKKNPLFKTFRILLFLPSILSSVITVTMFKYFLVYGLQDIYDLFGLGTVPNYIYDPETGFSTIVAYSFWVNFGGSIILFLGLMNRIPPEILEAASLDGITPVKEFLYIILPLIFPTISIYIINLLAGFFAQQGSLYTFYGSDARQEFYTFGYYYYIQVLGEAGVAKYPVASAAGLLFTLVTVPVTLGARWLMNKLCPSVDY